MGGWVGGWVGGWILPPPPSPAATSVYLKSSFPTMPIPSSRSVPTINPPTHPPSSSSIERTTSRQNVA